MPIDPSVLQRRHWQDGRIRLGVKKISKNGKEYPSKIDTFRFTSPSKEMIEGVAELYGGQVQSWESPQGPQFEVVTDAQRIPVIVPPNGLSQNMELWDGKLCVRRCTGVAMQPPFVGPCLCGADRDIKHRLCKPHTRLGVFLKEVRSLGLWRLDSKGGNAAAELPNAAEFLAHAGSYVDAWLYIAERGGTIIDKETGRPKPTTYMVPGLTMEGASFDELMSGRSRAALSWAGAASGRSRPRPRPTTLR
ncbi:recombination directionality factor [Thermocatellispora tengchongensis]|uniref:recombination directionality factor n=1 Tax=Thermocatellispora tengchongensis TaxID=1073253 RepID=UPI003638EC2F